MSYLLALDAGTGSIRAVIFDLNGRQLAVGQAEWKHLSVDNVPGSMEFDLTTNWQLACQCIRQALDAARLSAADIQSVACCSMREGIVLYDRNGEAIWACAKSMPAPAAKWRSLRRSTTIASNPRYTRSRDKPWRSAPCRACCGWRTTAPISTAKRQPSP